MKGYALLLVLVAALLLLLPLPALPAATDHDAPPATTTIPTATTTTTTPKATPSTTTAPFAAESVGFFRLLVGENVVELEEREFLIRTLAYEMPPTYHTEALKAQAVAAYTYHARRRALQRETPDPTLKGADFAVTDVTFPGNYSSEALRRRWGDSYDLHYNKLCAAVDAVLGKTVCYDGALIDACYFAISSGTTEDAATLWGSEVPYLRSVASPGDTLSPQYETKVSFTPAQLAETLSNPEGLTVDQTADPAGWLGEASRSAAGTVTALPVQGTPVTGTRLRELLELRSACFTVAYGDGQFTFTVRGYGHGVGMSQYGADYLARQGYTYEEILKYYYTNVEVR